MSETRSVQLQHMEDYGYTDIGFNYLISRNYLIEGIGFDLQSEMRPDAKNSLLIGVFLLMEDIDDPTLLLKFINLTIFDGQIMGKLSRKAQIFCDFGGCGEYFTFTEEPPSI